MRAFLLVASVVLLQTNAENQLPELLDDGISVVHSGETIATFTNHYYVRIKQGTSKTRLRQLITELGGEVQGILKKGRMLAIKISNSEELRRWHDTEEVTLVEPMPTYHRLSESVPSGIAAVQSDQVWFRTEGGSTGSSNVVVCVIDDGINPDHEEFGRDRFVNTNPVEEWTSCSGCNHGQHVAGTIAAKLNNGVGVAGVAPQVSLASVRVFNSQGQFDYPTGLVGALEECERYGATVVSMSLGGPFSSQSEKDAFAEFPGLAVAAAGNDGTDWFSYPASYPDVIGVGAVDSSNNLASFSQRNDQVELVAPGVNVLSTIMTSTVRSLSTLSPVTSYDVAEVIGSGNGDVTGPLFNAFGNCRTELSGIDLTGRVCHCRRGGIGYRRKVLNAQRAGCSALIISNNRAGLVRGRIRGQAAIPVVMTTQDAGSALESFNGLNQVDKQARVVDSSGTLNSGYGYASGTSMACPHVSGVAALLFSAVPDAKPDQVRECMIETAKDLGTDGRDYQFGAGLVQANDALTCLIAKQSS